MAKERINRIEIDWKDLFKPISGLQTGPTGARVINEIVVKQEIIPIIFVPGIMGSRLKYTKGGARAWDPDGQIFMLNKYGRLYLEPEDRKLNLIGERSHESNYLSVDNDNAKHNRKLPDGMGRNGWGGVYWGGYGKILKTLAAHSWPEPLNACFHFPVYAFGYNWTNCCTESGGLLARFIDQKIKENANQGPCTKVILVTHSMGGLVARAACNPKNPDNVKDKVLGIVHGVQPATGAAAAYFRMKTGFEPAGNPPGTLGGWLQNPLKLSWSKIKGTVGNFVLGNHGEEVTIIMANSPGALELLPNKLYKDNSGSAQWLSYTDKLGKRRELPNGDPYSNIYRLKEAVYRLVNPEWLGQGEKQKEDELPSGAEPDKWNSYLINLDYAKDFHEKLADAVHPETYQFYATGVDTVDRVDIVSRRQQIKGPLDLEAVLKKKNFTFEIHDEKGNMLVPDNQAMPGAYVIDAHNTESADAHDPPEKCIVFSLKPPSGTGDSTVPDSSGKALKVKASGYTQARDTTVAINGDDESWYNRKHDSIYNNKTAQHITLKAIENLCKYEIKKRTGAA